jgi:hypothetical protein
MKKLLLLSLAFFMCLAVACQPDKTFEQQINANGGISTPYVLYPDGTKQTTANGGSGTMVYPSAGIPLSTGTSWGTSIVNNSANWNTAFSWGNHVGLYKPISYVPAWAEITGKPNFDLLYKPITYVPTWTEITGKPNFDLLYKPITYVPTWTEITGKPLTFPPAVHTHDWTEIVNKPTEIELANEIPLLQGISIPKMTTTQITSLVNPDEGLQVYDITLHVMKFWNGTIWKIYPTTN